MDIKYGDFASDPFQHSNILHPFLQFGSFENVGQQGNLHQKLNFGRIKSVLSADWANLYLRYGNSTRILENFIYIHVEN